MECMGGEKRFVERLDSLFTMYLPDSYFAETEDVTREGIMGNYVHGNEVSHHIPYLYMWTKEPWKTQYWLRETTTAGRCRRGMSSPRWDSTQFVLPAVNTLSAHPTSLT